MNKSKQQQIKEVFKSINTKRQKTLFVTKNEDNTYTVKNFKELYSYEVGGNALNENEFEELKKIEKYFIILFTTPKHTAD